MRNRRKYYLSIIIFLSLVALSVPFHIESTNKIVSKQKEVDGVEGFNLEDSLKIRFQPRQYIQIEHPTEIQIIEHPESIYEE